MQAVSLPREADGQERGVDVGGHMTGCRNRKRKVTWRRQAYRAFLSSPPQPAQTSPRCWLGGRGCRPHKQQTTLDRPPWPTQGDRPIRDAMGWMARDALGIASHRIPAGASMRHVPGAKSNLPPLPALARAEISITAIHPHLCIMAEWQGRGIRIGGLSMADEQLPHALGHRPSPRCPRSVPSERG